jgi:hypothetical protein
VQDRPAPRPQVVEHCGYGLLALSAGDQVTGHAAHPGRLLRQLGGLREHALRAVTA